MRLRTRNELKSFFQNGKPLSQSHFAELIDAVLNKRDDKFYGVWQPGRTYCPGDVVIYEGSLWIASGQGEICATSDQPPGRDNPDWDSLIIPVDDNDWEVLENEGVMWAKVFKKIGIGIGNHEGERPEARLDVRKEEQGRWLLFPENAENTLFTLLHYASKVERSYWVTGISLEEATWLSDAAKGFAFRKGQMLKAEAEALDLVPAEGQIMMAIKPKRIADGSQLATLGLNVEDPAAMLDITDGSRGQLLFTPDEKVDPALTIVNLDPKCNNNYFALGVGKNEAALVSDAPNGFIFRRGGEYGEYCNEKDAGQGELLALIRQHPDYPRPQVGIGTGSPQARLDIKDGKDGVAQVQILPEAPPLEGTAEGDRTGDAVPAIALLNLVPEQPTYLTTGLAESALGGSVAGWGTNAKRGFVFRQGGPALIEANHQRIDQGTTFLAIREDGRIGMGTEEPSNRLEIVSQLGSGKFLFNLEKKVNPALGILNLRPGSKENYFTIGADNNHAILVTDSQYGFQFKAGKTLGTNDSQIDINQGRPLVSIRPEGKGRLGIGTQPVDYELDMYGLARTFTLYQDTNSNQITKIEDLTNVLKRVQQLKPILFEWKAKDLQEEGQQIGFLAHEVEEVFPQVVKTASYDATRAVAYQNLVPVLVQALKELSQTRNATHVPIKTVSAIFICENR